MQILFEDNHCLAVAKPPALLTQGVPPGIPTLEAMAKDYLREHYHKKGNVYLGIPHRLDRPVSGVVLFARNTKAARRLAEQFSKREVIKIYWAIVEGLVDPSQGAWHDWLLKIKEEARAERVERSAPTAATLQAYETRSCILPRGGLRPGPVRRSSCCSESRADDPGRP